jgi:hypothetical protein
MLFVSTNFLKILQENFDFLTCVPDRGTQPKIYWEEIQTLKDLITQSIATQELHSHKVVMKQVSHAVATFSKDINSKIDFMDISIKENLIDASYQYLEQFFNYCYRNVDFHRAMKMLQDRFLDSFHHHLVRSGTTISPMQAPHFHQERLAKLYKKILPMVPCSATKKFDGIEQPVKCESTQEYHGNVHQSSQTYKKKGFIIETSVPCRWEGEMENPYPVGWFVDPDILKSPPLTGTDFFNNHKRVQESQKEVISITANDDLVCLGCILGRTTELLECKHRLCTPCSEELLVDGLVECPFCNKKAKWKHEDIPSGASIRALTIHGEGSKE